MLSRRLAAVGLGAAGAHPVALAVDPEDNAAVGQPVEHGGGDHRVVEDLLSRVGAGAAVRTVHLAAPAADEDQASAGARSAPTALLHPWKAAVPLPLSRSMQLDTAATAASGNARTAPIA
jgi:hypothetical protein